MTISEIPIYYKYHNENKKAIENAIALIQENLRHCYRIETDLRNATIYIINKKLIKKLQGLSVSQNILNKLNQINNQQFNSDKVFDKKLKRLLTKKEFNSYVGIIKNNAKNDKKFETNQNDIISYSRILYGLMVSWSEESIRRLYYETDVFSLAQMDYLIEKSLEQKWSLALKIAFCKAYGLVPTSNEICLGIRPENETSIDADIRNKYSELKDLITDFLVPAFNIRNKVQHGEWINAFKPRYSKEYSATLTSDIAVENIRTIQARITIFNSVYRMIVDLATFKSNNFQIDASTTPFEYFYKQHRRKIEQERNNILNPDLVSYKQNLVEKQNRGKIYKKSKFHKIFLLLKQKIKKIINA